MDISVLPLAEVDLKIEDVAIKFENEDEKGEFDDISHQYESAAVKAGKMSGKYFFSFSTCCNNPKKFCGSSDMQANLNLLREADRYDKVNFHFLTTSPAKVESNVPLRRFQCNNCLRLFTRNDHLKNHMRTHTGERPYECDQCQRSFAKHFDLTRHKRYVHGSVTTFFICEECGRTFSRKDHLKSHLITHKNRPMKISSADDRDSLLKTFTCETCGRTYCRLENLKRHMEKHCENLDEANRIPKGIINDLKDEAITENIFKGINFHFMSVNDVKPATDHPLRSFACEFCERLFVRKDHLKNHERTHTGERPFQCEQCDKRFAKRFVMTRHLRNVHRIGTKMHKCSECERMFARTDHLKTHMKIHILAAVRNQQQQHHQQQQQPKEKMHKCEICDREFTRSDNLKTHMKIHLLAAVKSRQQQQGQEFGEEEEGYEGNQMTYQSENEIKGGNYFCEICEESFPSVEALERHEETHRDHS